MTITVPKLKKHKPILVAPSIRIYYPKQWTWQDHLQELELQYNNSISTYNTQEITMKDMKHVNEVMQALYPGPYRVVEKYLTDRMVFGFSLEFDDPHEKIIWLLKNS
jgi:hypothetical protein